MRLTGTVRIEFNHCLERDPDDVEVLVVGEWDRDHGECEVIEVRDRDLTQRLVALTREEEDALLAELRERAACWDDGAAEDAAEHRREMREWR
jgi:hypothetical protein